MRCRSLAVASLTLCWLSLTGCIDRTAEQSAQAVSSARQCGTQEIAPGLLLRLSTYSSEGIPGNIISVVELCHPERGCSAVASYQNGMAPLVVSQDPQLVIQIPMADDLRIFEETTWIRGRQVGIRIEAKTIRTEDELDAARTASGLPPGRVSYDNCRRDLTIRPFYRDAAS